LKKKLIIAIICVLALTTAFAVLGIFMATDRQDGMIRQANRYFNIDFGNFSNITNQIELIEGDKQWNFFSLIYDEFELEELSQNITFAPSDPDLIAEGLTFIFLTELLTGTRGVIHDLEYIQLSDIANWLMDEEIFERNTYYFAVSFHSYIVLIKDDFNRVHVLAHYVER